ncbi:hypothetical protein AUO94_10385 [Planococcus kocurii]|uniref:Transposase n=1 Tax=Planococcus kocurii TaxID=1374 RepID=A0ABM5WXU5_9BACL|nr:hypothetical protein [Planococcus kocurii]ALS79043.2 hypothetical protein AUO94_10385 [Planococcus kocurii]
MFTLSRALFAQDETLFAKPKKASHLSEKRTLKLIVLQKLYTRARLFVYSLFADQATLFAGYTRLFTLSRALFAQAESLFAQVETLFAKSKKASHLSEKLVFFL